MAKYNIYAIGYGIDPNTKAPVSGLKVPTWKECESYVKGVEGAKYKGFLSDTEADMWLSQVSGSKPKPTVSNSPAGVKVQQAIEKDMDINEARSKFVDICNNCKVNPQEMLNKLIMDFVNTHKFLHPEQPTKEEEEEEDFGKLPFN